MPDKNQCASFDSSVFIIIKCLPQMGPSSWVSPPFELFPGHRGTACPIIRKSSQVNTTRPFQLGRCWAWEDFYFSLRYSSSGVLKFGQGKHRGFKGSAPVLIEMLRSRLGAAASALCRFGVSSCHLIEAIINSTRGQAYVGASVSPS